MPTLRQPTNEVNPRIPITAFVYLIPKKKFVYLPTGRYWVVGGVNSVLAPMDGLKATEWLKRHRAVMVLPEWRQP